MKKLLLIGAFVLVASQAQAKDNVGCGLGSIAFQGQRGVVSDVLASTTNGWLGTQTFGMSSGTSGCEKGLRIENREMTTFVTHNYETLIMAAAKADATSETMISAASILNVEPAYLAKLTNANFDSIFTDGAEANEVVYRIESLL